MTEPKIRRLRQDDPTEIKIACIRPGGWRDVIAGREYKFDEGEVLLTDRAFGLFLVRRAKDAWNMSNQQSALERREYTKRMSSNDLHVRDTALEYCDKAGVPHTKAWPVSALVSLQTEEGKTAYYKWRAERKMEEADSPEPAKLETPEGVEIATEENDPGAMKIRDIDPPEAPVPTWSKEEKLAYIERYSEVTQLKAWSGLVKRDDMEPTLDKRVLETFEILKERYQQGG